MRQIFTAIVLALFAMTAVAQETEKSKHITFMGVPLGSKHTHFVKELSKKGFTFNEVVNRQTVSLKGDYEGYKDCDLYVYISVTDNTVSSVAVSLPFRDAWAELQDDYLKMKKNLIGKYGTPDNITEGFENREVQEDRKMLYVNTDRCYYNTVFNRENGMVSVAVTHTKLGDKDYSNVRIYYIDNPKKEPEKENKD